jgi:flavin-binding protein dodecin
MDDRAYKIIELVGVSDVSYDDAATRAIERAGKTLKGLGWFKVTELRGLIRDDEVAEYQVTLQVGFRLLDEADLKD